MTKMDLIENISDKTKFNRKESAELLEEVFAIMKRTLESGESLKISGFGNFEVKQKKDRKGRNPQTGEELTITARKILTFKPSAVLKQSINGKA